MIWPEGTCGMLAQLNYQDAVDNVLEALETCGFVGRDDLPAMQRRMTEVGGIWHGEPGLAVARVFADLAVEAQAGPERSFEDHFGWSLAARFALQDAGLGPAEVEALLAEFMNAARTALATTDSDRVTAAAFARELNIARRGWRLAD